MMNLLAVLMSVALVTLAPACGSARCGIIYQPGFGAANDAGVVVFGSTAVGTRETLGVPVQDSAPIDETITGVTLTGTGAAAFQVTTDFPLAVPAGTSALVAVQFAPTSAGMATATLVLQTASMGPSPIPLQGEGL